MGGNTSSKQGEILPTVCHFGKRTGIQLLLIQKDKFTHFTFEQLWFIFNNSGVQTFVSSTFHPGRGFSFRTGKRRTYFQKH